MQSHTQVYLSRNTMVPKYKTSVVPGTCTLLKGVGSLVPVPAGRGKNIQRVGSDWISKGTDDVAKWAELLTNTQDILDSIPRKA